MERYKLIIKTPIGSYELQGLVPKQVSEPVRIDCQLVDIATSELLDSSPIYVMVINNRIKVMS